MSYTNIPPVCRLHGSPVGDQGVSLLVSGLLKLHASTEQAAALADATKNIVSDVIHASLQVSTDVTHHMTSSREL